jgi:hypothetical protein
MQPASSVLWRYPGLGHVTFDGVPLNSRTVRASKRPQILAPHARLNHHQSHGRTAGDTLRALVLFIEHLLLPEAGPQLGVLGPSASQPTAFDSRGSDAIKRSSTWSHLGHSNSRCSNPIGPGEMRSSIIGVWQREQRGRSIAVKNCWDEIMALLRRGGSVTELSAADGLCCGHDPTMLA